MIYWLKKLYRPEYYQKKWGSRYFEGWYFKFVFDQLALAVIPGISLTPGNNHAFIQVNRSDTLSDSPAYTRFDPEAFSARRDRFQISVGPNQFSLSEIAVDLEGLQANLKISNLRRWPAKLFSPNSMGWYAFVQIMECYHGVIVLDAEVEGIINGQPQKGRFYLEKDWGMSFPQAWVWMQTNSFSVPASLTCSIATVPFRRRSFTGYIIALYTENDFYPFTTYNGTRLIGPQFQDDWVVVTAQRDTLSLEIRARRTQGAELASPVEGDMRGRIQESLDSTVAVVLRESDRVLFEDTGTQAGLEVVHPEKLEIYQ